MRVYISADMEGVGGVTHPQDVIPGRPRYETARLWMTREVNAAIAGAAGAGATEFVVNDSHDGMRNLDLDELDERAEVVVGNRKPLVMMEGYEGADLVFLLGYHGRAGSAGVLSHTFRGVSVVGVELNGAPCSEGRMNAAVAGLAGVPVGLVTGDDLICAESAELYPGARTAQVKTAIDRYTARCLAPERARAGIRARAADAVRWAASMKPYTPEGPHTFIVEFANASLAASTLYFPDLKLVGERRVSWTHEDYRTAYRMFIGVMRLASEDPDFG